MEAWHETLTEITGKPFNSDQDPTEMNKKEEEEEEKKKKEEEEKKKKT